MRGAEQYRHRVDKAPIEQIRTAYDSVAASYSELLSDTSFEAEIDLAMIQHFLGRLVVQRSAHVLDAGCGAGRMLTYLEQLDPSLHLTGVDLAPSMVGHARARHPTRRIEEGDLAALPFGGAEFDGLLSWYSIIHTFAPELPRVVEEFRRVIRPGGLLLVAFHSGTGERVVERAYGHDVELRVQLHNVQHVDETLTAGGFEVGARLDRLARPGERNSQGFLLATRT